MRKVVFASIIACVCCGLFTGCNIKRVEKDKPKEPIVQEVTIVTNDEGEVVAAASSVTPEETAPAEEAPATPVEEEAPADEAK